jgi:Mrp family chromosome partitioning ATPase
VARRRNSDQAPVLDELGPAGQGGWVGKRKARGELRAQVQLQAELRQHYRQITNRLLLQERPGDPWLIGVTSAVRGEGKTLLAYGLATTLAADLPESVALLELDFERPVMAAEMGLDPSPGLAEVVQMGAPLLAAGRPTHLPNLTVVPAGQVRGDQGPVAHAPVLRQVWPALVQFGSIIICDLPAVLVNPDTPLLARQMGTIVMAVRAGVTPAPLVDQALDQLDRSRVAGIVLNGEQHRLPRWIRRALGEWSV